MSANRPDQPIHRVLRDDDDHDGVGRNFAERRETMNGTLETGWWREPERTKLPHAQYTIGWICALPIELAASHVMLDEVHQSLPKTDGDANSYILGNIETYNIVMACLPKGQYGITNAAIVASNMKRTFGSIQFSFMVGIGGGVPGENDIRLGDVVVGDYLLQHDIGKVEAGDNFRGTGIKRLPPPVLSNAVSKLMAVHQSSPSLMTWILDQAHDRHPDLKGFRYPARCQDRLFCATYDHPIENPDCSQCDSSKVKDRRPRETRNPQVHYGGIASGNQVIKYARHRDVLAKKHGVLCFEMEAAGLVDTLPCMVVRGICDYADSHKNKEWQKYAAATAAAYTKELILILDPSQYNNTPITSPPGIPTETLKEKFRARRESLLQMLRFDQIDSRRETIGTAHVQTCEWLLCDATYHEWLNPSGRGFLWISGKPGAGKSTLMKFISNQAIKNSFENPGAKAAIVSFFFNARGVELEMSTSGLYRSLVLQLLEAFPGLQSVLDDITLVPLKQNSCPLDHTLQELLRGAVLALGNRQLTCFIDALDECDETEVRKMVVYFEGLHEMAVLNHIQLKICFSSRHYPHIRVKGALKLTLEDQVGHKEDLQRYVKAHLRAGEDETYAQSIRDKIMEKASGVFMWVILVVDILSKELDRGRLFALERRLQELPTKLGDLFTEIVMRDDDNMEDFILCCQWVLFAKRPLHPEELYIAMLTGSSGSQQDSISYAPLTEEYMKLFVNSSSKGLAETTKSTNPTVQFVHESVKDFLVKENGLERLQTQHRNSLPANRKVSLQALGHDRLKECCKLHIAGHIDSFSPGNVKEQRGAVLKIDPFLKYAIEHVLHHADTAAEGVPQDNFIDEFSTSGWVHMTNKIGFHRYPEDISLLYVLADNNFRNLVETFIRRYPGIHPKGGQYGYPFFAALVKRHWTVAKAFLGSTVTGKSHEQLFPWDDLTQRFNYSEDLMSHPINWAIENDYTHLASQMITSGHFNLLDSDKFGRSPIHSAAITGHDGLMTALVQQVVPHPEHSTNTGGAITEAGESRNEDVDSLFFKRRLKLIETKDSTGSAPLLLAIRNFREKIIRRLLAWGADSHITLQHIGDPQFQQPEKMSKHIANFLVEESLVTKWTLLVIAARHDLRHIIETLVDNEEFFLDGSHFGAEALEEAARCRQDAALRLLLSKGASNGCQKWDSYGLIHQAAFMGQNSEVEWLVNNGASLDSYYPGHDTPLHSACRGAHEVVVRTLLACGAKVNIQDQGGKSALHQAAQLGREEIVRVLLDNGADIHVLDREGQTARSIAVSSGQSAVLKLLDEAHLNDAVAKANKGRSKPRPGLRMTITYTVAISTVVIGMLLHWALHKHYIPTSF